MALVPIDPGKLSVRPELLDEHAARVASATDVSRTFAARHAGYVDECAVAWAGSSAEALAELSAHWEATDARLHGSVGAFSEAMREGGRHYAVMEQEHARRFTVLVPRRPDAS